MFEEEETVEEFHENGNLKSKTTTKSDSSSFTINGKPVTAWQKVKMWFLLIVICTTAVAACQGGAIITAIKM